MPPSPVYRHLGVHREKDITVVRFGEHRILDELTVNRLSEELYTVADRADCQKLVLDFTGVDHLTTLMLGKLLMLRRRMESKGGRLVVCELDPRIVDVLATTHLDKIIEVKQSQDEALAAFA